MNEEESTGKKQEGLSDTDFSALLDGMTALAPLLKPILGTGGDRCDKQQDRGSHRDALLRALKPYLSPSRREAVDSLIKIGRIGDLIAFIQ